MKRTLTVILFVSSMILFSAVGSSALEKPVKIGDMMPDIELPVPESELHRDYLGLSGSGNFNLEDIKSKVLIIQVYTMY